MRLQSRQLRSLTPFFPDVVDALGTWFRDVVLDGVIWGPRWRVQEVADRPPEVRPPVLWTAYLRLVHDGRRPRELGAAGGLACTRLTALPGTVRAEDDPELVDPQPRPVVTAAARRPQLLQLSPQQASRSTALAAWSAGDGCRPGKFPDR